MQNPYLIPGVPVPDRIRRVSSREEAPRRATTDCASPAARVLAIDSDPGRRSWIASAFEAEQTGFAVWGAGTTEEFQRALSGVEFDVVVTELRLLWGTALEVLRAVRKRRVDVPVLLLTGDGDEACAAEAMRRGFADYLPRARTTPERFVHHVRIALALSPRSAAARGVATRLACPSPPARRASRARGNGFRANDGSAVSSALRRMANRVSWEVCDAADHLLKVLDPDLVPFGMDAQARARMDEGRAAAERVASLAVGLRSYAAGGGEPPQRTDVNRVVRAVVERQRERGSRIQVAFVADRAAAPVQVPPQAFERGIAMLLGLAVAAAPRRGRVSVETSRSSGTPGPADDPRRALPQVMTELSMTWSGEGPIVESPSELLEPLFPPPFPAPPGALDLAVFYEAIRGAGGDVTVDSVRGRTRLRVALPGI